MYWDSVLCLMRPSIHILCPAYFFAFLSEDDGRNRWCDVHSFTLNPVGLSSCGVPRVFTHTRSISKSSPAFFYLRKMQCSWRYLYLARHRCWPSSGVWLNPVSMSWGVRRGLRGGRRGHNGRIVLRAGGSEAEAALTVAKQVGPDSMIDGFV